MQKSGNTSMARSALLLCLGGIICKVIGALFKVPLTNVLGAEGMGLYQTVFPVFSLLLILSSGGISQTVSVLVSSNERAHAKHILSSATLLVTVGVFVVGALLFFLAPFISVFQGVDSASSLYLALIPALIFSGYSAVIKGYFQALSNVFPTFISQVIEQTAKLVFGLFLAISWVSSGTVNGVLGALIGISISEFLSLAFLFFRYILGKDRPKIKTCLPFSFDFLRVLRYALPLTLGGIIMPLSSLIDSVTIINFLSPILGASESTAVYGLMSGTVSTLTNLPAVFTVALSVAVVPVIAKDKGAGLFSALFQKGRISIKLTLFICIPVSAFLIVLSPFVINLLYPNLSLFHKETAIKLLAISSLGITALGVNQIYSSLLFSVGLNSKSIKNLIIAVVIKCILLYPALSLWGIYGACGVNVLCYSISAILNARVWRCLTNQNSDLSSAVKILSLSVLLTFSLFLIIPYLNTFLVFALSILFVLLYLYMALTSGVFLKDEILSLPFGEKLLKTSKRKE